MVVPGFVPAVALAPERAVEDGYTRQRGTLESEPGLHVPFWLLIPAGTGPWPLALTPHGHTHHGADQYAGLPRSPEDARKIARKRKDLAVQAVRRGYACIAPATRGFAPLAPAGPAEFTDDQTCLRQLTYCNLRGRTPLGERIWDLRLLLDWALGTLDLDGTVLAAGHSGGGFLAMLLAAVDTRVGLAVNNCAFAPFIDGDGQVTLCPCNAIPGILEWGGIAEICALIAPRPFLALGGVGDRHDVASMHRLAEQVRQSYRATGAVERFAFFEGQNGCRVYREEIWDFIARQRAAEGRQCLQTS